MENRYIATDGNVKKLGRTALRNDILWCAFSATGIEFVSRGKKVAIELIGDSSYTDENNKARYAIYLDGKLAIDDVMTDKKRTVTVVETAEETVHVVRFIKLSESAMSTIGIAGVVVEDGNILPTSDREIFVEYIGDSITCGYGVDDEDPEHHFITATEDVSKSFSYTSAQMLGVDHSMVSFSGYGVISGYTGDGVINSIELLPPHYEKLGFSYATSGTEGDEFKVGDIKWDFSGRKPELVVINLGTNDMSYTGDDKEKQAMYQERYIELLKLVKKHYPDTYILSILGMMGDLLYPALEEAVERYKKETGDDRIETMHIDPIKADTEGYVADYHPTKVTHKRAARQVADRLIEIADREYKVKLGKKLVALTFDDGPNTTTTLDVLDLLQKKDAKGTFFLIGKNITEESAKSVKKALELGFEIENHSITHPAMSDMTVDAFMAEINECSDRVEKLTGRKPKFFRPPYIAVSQEMLDNIPLTLICGAGCEDWDMSVSAERRAQKTLAQLYSGRIILLHDMEGNDNTVKALETIIDIAKNYGYEFVTLEELFEGRGVEPRLGLLYNEAK